MVAAFRQKLSLFLDGPDRGAPNRIVQLRPSRAIVVGRTLLVTALGVAAFFLLQGGHARVLYLTTSTWPTGSTFLRPLVYLVCLPALAHLLLGRLLPRVFPLGTSSGSQTPSRPAAGPARPGMLIARLGAGALVGFGLALASGAHWFLVRGQGSVPAAGAGSWNLVAVLTAVVVTPLLEEWFYRGELQRFLDRGARWWSLLLQAGLFALLHPPAVWPMLLLVGLSFGGLYWRLGLGSAMVAHAVYNAALFGLHGLFAQ